jgi:Fe-S oxidoreductase
MPGIKFSERCPSLVKYLFDAYSAFGRLRLAWALMEGRLDYSPSFLDAVYQCTLGGACDVGCKRNLDLEPLLVLETLRARCVKDGQGPMPEHRKIAESIARTHNRLGAPHENRLNWFPQGQKPATKSQLLYFVGCASSYVHQEIAQATMKILNSAGQDFAITDNEWCCGYLLYSTGQVEEAKKQMEHNLAAIRDTGAKTVVVSCAECYHTLKVTYPKLLGISTSELGFEVLHITEYVDRLLNEGKIKLANKVDLKATYHDPCNLARLSEPWIQWEGKRTEFGCLEPPKEFRRGTHGVYQPPRNILKAIPGIELVEMPRFKENAWCCGSGGGVKEAFPDFALWTAEERISEVKAVAAEAIVSACPHCKTNFQEAIERGKDKIAVYDITEIISQAISK